MSQSNFDPNQDPYQQNPQPNQGHQPYPPGYDPQQPGFKHILLRPNFPSDLKQFEARHRSPYGEIQSQWERKKKSVVYSVTIPANSSATLYVPDTVKGERVIELEAGKHTFEWKLL